MLISKRQEKQLGEIAQPLTDLIKQITDAPENDLPELLKKNMKWETSKSSLLNWVPVLNRFDAILERITTKYGLSEENCKPVILKNDDVALLSPVLDFTHMLLDNSTNKSVYASSHRLFDLLNSPTISIAIKAIKCLIIIGKRYMGYKHGMKWFIFERKLSERVLFYTHFLPASTLTSNTGTNDNLSLINFIKESPQIPSKWKHLEFVFYPSDQQIKSSSVALSASQVSGVEASPSLKRARSVQTTPSPSKKKTKNTKIVKGDKVEQFVMSEENVRKLSLQQIFDMGCEKVSPKYWLRFGLEATVAKAFNANSYENIKLRQDLVILKSLSVAFLVLVNNDFDITSRVFEADPTLLSALIDLVNLQNVVPRNVRLAAVQSLECIAAKKTWSSEIVRGLGGSVSHGLVFQNLRVIIKQLKENRSEEVFEEFNLFFFNLIAYLVSTKSLSSILVAAGLIQHLSEFIHLPTDFKGTCAAAIHLLEGLVSGNSDHVTLFRESKGYDKLIAAVGSEIDFALANPGYAGGPPTLSIVHYSISFKQANLIRSLLRFVQHLIQKESGDRARNLFDSPLLGHLNKILLNTSVFGYTLITLAINIVSLIIHNEPTSYPILKEAGVIDIIVDNFESFFGKSADLLLSLPSSIGAIALNNDGLQKVKDKKLIPKLFTIFDNQSFAKVLVQDDSSELLGNAIDELARHYPDFKPIIEDEMISLIDRLPRTGTDSLPRPQIYQSPNGSFYHSKDDEVIENEEGSKPLDTWESIEAAYIMENAAVALGNSIQGRSWVTLMNRVPIQKWIPLITAKNLPFDYLFSNALYPINGALKFFDDERREYAPRELVNEISKRVEKLADYFTSTDECSVFQTLDGDAEKSDDLFNRLITANNVLFAFVDVFCNPSSLSSTRVDQLATFFSDDMGVKLIKNLGKLLKRVAVEESALRTSMPSSVADETMMTQYDDGFPPLRIYQQEPPKDLNTKFDKTSAKFKNSCQVRLVGHRLHTSIVVLFNTLLMLPSTSRQDFTLDSFRGFSVLISQEITSIFADFCDPKLFSKPSLYLDLIYSLQYCLTDPNSDKVITLGAIMFLQAGGFSKIKEGLLHFWEKMNELDAAKISEIKDLSYVKDTEESIVISIVMNILVFLNKITVYESLGTVHNSHLFYEGNWSGALTINANNLAASFAVQSKLLGFGVLERILSEHMFGSFEEDQQKAPEAVITEVVKLSKNIYSTSGERNLNQSDGSLFQIDWLRVKTPRSRIQYLMDLGLSQQEASAFISRSGGSLAELESEDIPQGIPSREKWDLVRQNAENLEYTIKEPQLAEPQFEHYHTLTELEDVRQMKNDFIVDQMLLVCQLYPKLASTQIAEFFISSFLGLGKSNVATFETNVLHTILEFIYSFDISAENSKSLSAMLSLFCALVSNDTVFYGSHAALEDFMSFVVEVLKPEYVNCDWFADALSVCVKIVYGSQLPDLEKLEVSSSLAFTPKAPACFKVDSETSSRLFNVIVSVPEITSVRSALPLSRLLSAYASSPVTAVKVSKSGVVQKILKAISYPQLEENERPFALHTSFVYLVRKCCETENNIRDFVAREINRQYQSKSKKDDRVKSRDLLSVVKEASGAVIRAPELFIEEMSKRARFTDFTNSSLKNLTTKLIDSSQDDEKTEIENAPSTGGDPGSSLKDHTGIVHLLLTELMSTSKNDWYTDPPLTEKETEQFQKEKEKSETAKPPKSDITKNKHCAYMIFLLKVITELLVSYKQSKLEFLTFSKKQLFQVSVDDSPKPRSTSLNFFLHQLITDVAADVPEGERERKKAISDLAQGAIIAFVSTVDQTTIKVDPKKVDPDMTFIRKFTTDTIHKVIKDAAASAMSLKAMTLRVSSLCRLFESLLKPTREKYLDSNTVEFDSYHIAVTVIESNLQTTLSTILSEVDLNYAGHAFLLDSILSVMSSLADVKVRHQDLFRSSNPSSGVDEEEVEEDENDFKDETPDLFQNSTLGMYDVAEIDSEEEGFDDENASYDEEDEEDIEDLEEAMAGDGSIEIVYSEEDDDLDDEPHMLESDDGEVVDSDGSSSDNSEDETSDSESDSDEDMEDHDDDGYIRYDIVPDLDDLSGDDDDNSEEGDFLTDEEAEIVLESDIDDTLDQLANDEVDEPQRGSNSAIVSRNGVISVDLDADLDEALNVGSGSQNTNNRWRVVQGGFDDIRDESEEDVESMFNSDDEDSLGDIQELIGSSRLFSRPDRIRARSAHSSSLNGTGVVNLSHLFHQRYHGNSGSPSSLEAYYNYFVDFVERAHGRTGFDFLPTGLGRRGPSELKIMPTRERYNTFASTFFNKNDPSRVVNSIINRAFAPSLEAFEAKRREEDARRQEEENKRKAEEEERRRKLAEEQANAEIAGEIQSGTESNREPVWVMVGDRQVDIRGTEIDPEFFEALPDYMREDVLTQHIRERRAQASQDGHANREIDQDFLDALPDNIREEILTQEVVDNRLRAAAAANGAADATEDAGNSTEQAADPVKKDEKQKMFFTPLLDKAGVASLLRYIFSPRSFNGRRHLYSLLGQLCINKQTRAEVLGLLLAILQDGIASQDALEKTFSQISMRSRQPVQGSTSGVSKISGTPRTPSTPLQPKGSHVHMSTPLRGSPFVIACQVLEALQFLLESDPQLRYFFLAEHEPITLSKKGASAKKPHLVKPSKYPLNTLLSLLELSLVKEKSVLMDLLSRIIQITTRPLTAMKKVQDSKDNKKKIELPNIVGGSLKNVVTILVSDDCSSRTFQQTLSAMQNLLVVKAHNVFSNELSRHATGLAETLIADLRVMVDLLAKNGEDSTDFDADIMLKFTSSSSVQSKLLRVLTALDYLFGGKAGADGDEQSVENKELTKLYNNLSLGSLWGSLSDALDLFEANKNITHMATTVLPLIEALMVVCKHSKVKELQAKDALKYESQKCDFTNERIEDLFFSFTNKHKKILNQMVRSNAKLMSGPFAMLVKNPKILEFDNKKNYFDRQLHVDDSEKVTLAVNVSRDQVFLDSYRSLFFKPKEEFRNAKLDISFKNEAGVDAGGVTREWYQVLSRQMFNPDYALFLPVASDKTTFHPNRTSWVNPEHLSFFKFIGRVIGKALYDGCFLDCHFSRDVYKSILGRPVSLKDLETIDLEYYNSLMWMLENDITDVIIETFSVETDDYGEVKTIDLVPGGRDISVTEENKHEYVRLVVEYRLQKSVEEQVDNFLQGFHEVIPKELIAIFDEQELELLISGLPDIDVDDWKNNTTYVNYNSNSKEVGYFWRAVRSFDKEERAKLLQFATGTSKVPLNGFKELEGASGATKFSIHKDFGRTDRLPQSHTCFNQIDLPAYDSYETLRRALLIAITEGHEGFGLA